MQPFPILLNASFIPRIHPPKPHLQTQNPLPSHSTQRAVPCVLFGTKQVKTLRPICDLKTYAGIAVLLLTLLCSTGILVGGVKGGQCIYLFTLAGRAFAN